MKLIYHYLLNQFLFALLSIFFVLFCIVSLLFFIQLARLSSSIDINFFDLIKLYSFMLPRILLFTMPISFFLALTLTFFRLSRENEATVLFTLGLIPTNLAIFFLQIAALMSVFMLLIALIFVPIASSLQDNFISYKRTQVAFNYKSGEFGQKFLGWLLFIKTQDKKLYKDIFLYHPKTQENKEQLIIAKQGFMEKNEAGYSFKLQDGKLYNFDDKNIIFMANFKDFAINSRIENELKTPEKFYQYWRNLNENKDKSHEFIVYVGIALFPIVSTLFALSFGIIVYRYERGFVYVGVFLLMAFYFGLLNVFYSHALVLSASIFVSFFLAGIFIFRRMIIKKY